MEQYKAEETAFVKTYLVNVVKVDGKEYRDYTLCQIFWKLFNAEQRRALVLTGNPDYVRKVIENRPDQVARAIKMQAEMREAQPTAPASPRPGTRQHAGAASAAPPVGQSGPRRPGTDPTVPVVTLIDPAAQARRNYENLFVLHDGQYKQ